MVFLSGPQGGGQSTSVRELCPAGQQPSLGVSLGCNLVSTHLTLQAVPARVCVVHGSLSLQSARVLHLPLPDLIPGSQPSPDSSTPLPQLGLQSWSLITLAPGGQQPSPCMGLVTGVYWQVTLHSLPVIESAVQGFLSSHLVGQAPALPAGIALSHFSPWSSFPLPQQPTSVKVVMSAASDWLSSVPSNTSPHDPPILQ